METSVVRNHCDMESWTTLGTCGRADVAERLRRAKHCGTLATWGRTEASEDHILATREVQTRTVWRPEKEGRAPALAMAERPEDLNLPNAVITRIIKEAVSCSGWRMGRGRTCGQKVNRIRVCVYLHSLRSSRTVSTSPRRPEAPSPAPPVSSFCMPHPGEPSRGGREALRDPDPAFVAWNLQAPVPCLSRERLPALLQFLTNSEAG